jgi:23S rRNA (adenine2503-C2)-methyltransferase
LPSELLGQIIAASADMGERVSNVVMMGIGEPLDNFDNVVKFLRLVNAEGGLNIGYRHISLSTSGIVPKIRELAEIELPITLSISLHATTDEKRSAIMPINNKWGIDELLAT